MLNLLSHWTFCWAEASCKPARATNESGTIERGFHMFETFLDRFDPTCGAVRVSIARGKGQARSTHCASSATRRQDQEAESEAGEMLGVLRVGKAEPSATPIAGSITTSPICACVKRGWVSYCKISYLLSIRRRKNKDGIRKI